jgi:hypothetical protein
MVSSIASTSSLASSINNREMATEELVMAMVVCIRKTY